MTSGKGSRNRDKTHCPQGHPLVGDNLVASDLKRGRRGCKECHNRQSAESRRRMRQWEQEQTW